MEHITSHGKIARESVQLQAYLVEKAWYAVRNTVAYDRSVTITFFRYVWRDRETEHCPQCSQEHAKLYGFYRKPNGAGCLAYFRYNGKLRIPDLSTPMALEKLPRDAKPLPLEYWHK